MYAYAIPRQAPASVPMDRLGSTLQVQPVTTLRARVTEIQLRNARSEHLLYHKEYR